MAEKQIKSRAFWFEVYPDSVVENWKEVIKSYHISFLVSPLHDKDVNADGSTKKAHYHIILIFPNSTTKTLADEIVKEVKGVRPPKDRMFACSSISACSRYLIHRDDADKYQYDMNDVYVYGDISYIDCMSSKYEEKHCISEMKLFIEQYRIVSIPLFTAFCRDTMPEWEYILNSVSYSILIERHIKSMNFILEKLRINVSYDTIYEKNSTDVLYHFDFY